MRKLRCILGLHKWKYLGTIGDPEYTLYRCKYCPKEKKKPNENDPHWSYDNI